MSQLGQFANNASGGATIDTITGNTGTVVVPDASNNVNILGSGYLTSAGSGSTLTFSLQNYSSSPAASNLVIWDANKNLSANSYIKGITTTASGGATVVLTVASTEIQRATGSSTQVYQMPDATTLANGQTFEFRNASTGTVTVNFNDTTVMATIPGGGALLSELASNGTTNGTWSNRFLMPSNANYGTTGMTVTGYVASTTNVIPAYATFTTSQTLTVTSPYSVYMTGSTAAQTMTLPVVSTLPQTGLMYMFMNNSSQTWSINSSGGNLVVSVPTNTMVIVECILLTGTTAASWNAMPLTYATHLAFTNGNNVTGTVTGGNTLSLAPTGSTIVNSGFAAWDANGNVSANNFITSYATTVTAAGTTALTSASAGIQFFTGGSGQTVTLPQTSTLTTGYQVRLFSTGSVITIRSFTSALIANIATNGYAIMTCISTANDNAGSWSYSILPFNDAITGSGNIVMSAAPNITGAATISASTLTSNAANAASAGVLRLATGDAIDWRNNGNSANISLSKNTNDVFILGSPFTATSVSSNYTTTATAAGTTTLTVASNGIQDFTGSTTQTMVLPVTSTLIAGFEFRVLNHSSGNVTVQSSGANTLATLTNLQYLVGICILTSGTGTASWSWYTGTLGG